MRLALAAVALVLTAVFTTRPAAAADATLSVLPASQTVDQGMPFAATVGQNASATTTGAQVDFNFDPGLVQVIDVTAGSAYGGASFLVGVAPQTKAQAIAEANTTGTLQNVSAFFLPGLGSVPAGDTTFIQLSLQAKNAGGTSPLTLSQAEMLDTAGNAVNLTLNAGAVTVTGPTATASPSPSPTPSITPVGQTPSPTPTKTPVPVPTPTPTATLKLDATLNVTPQSQTVPPNAEFPFTITQKANVVTTGAQTDLTFDPAIIQIVSVTRGQPYQKASLLMGVVPLPPATPLPNAQTIANANVTGTLNNIAAFFIPGSGSVPAGEAAFVTIKLKGKGDGRSPLTLSKVEMINSEGEAVGVAAVNGEVVVQTGAVLPASARPGVLPAGGGESAQGGGLPVIALALGVIATTGCGVAAIRLVRRRNTLAD